MEPCKVVLSAVLVLFLSIGGCAAGKDTSALTVINHKLRLAMLFDGNKYKNINLSKKGYIAFVKLPELMVNGEPGGISLLTNPSRTINDPSSIDISDTTNKTIIRNLEKIIANKYGSGGKNIGRFAITAVFHDMALTINGKLTGDRITYKIEFVYGERDMGVYAVITLPKLPSHLSITELEKQLYVTDGNQVRTSFLVDNDLNRNRRGIYILRIDNIGARTSENEIPEVVENPEAESEGTPEVGPEVAPEVVPEVDPETNRRRPRVREEPEPERNTHQPEEKRPQPEPEKEGRDNEVVLVDEAEPKRREEGSRRREGSPRRNDVDEGYSRARKGACPSCHVNAECINGCCSCPPELHGNGLVCKNLTEKIRIPGLYETQNGRQGVKLRVFILKSRVYFNLYAESMRQGEDSRFVFLSGVLLTGYMFGLDSRTGHSGLAVIGSNAHVRSRLTFNTGEVATVTYTFNIRSMNHQSVKQLDIKVEGTFPSHQSDIRFDIGRQSYNYMYKNEGLVTMNSTVHFFSKGGIETQLGTMAISDTITFVPCAEDLKVSIQVDAKEYDTELKSVKSKAPYVNVAVVVKFNVKSLRKEIATPERENEALPDCREIPICHVDAECTMIRGDEYACKCGRGFRGDGVNQCQAESCESRRDMCDTNARCVRGRLEVYSCRCNTGYTGDGQTCQESCKSRRDMCDTNARCVRERQEVYSCRCNTGYTGDGQTCGVQVDSDYALIYSQGMSLYRLPFHPTARNPGRQIAYLPGSTIVGIDVDCETGTLYYTDVVKRHIARLPLGQPSAVPEVVVDNLNSPEGVAIDWISRNIYYTDSEKDIIGVTKMDGTFSQVLFDKDISNPRAIVVDPSKGLIFWSDWQRERPRIVRATTAGQDRSTIISSDLGIPNALTLDPKRGEVCFADAGTAILMCCSYTGLNCREITNEVSAVFGLTSHDATFYWTDWNMNSISNVKRPRYNTFNKQNPADKPLQLSPGGNGKLYGITVAKTQCPIGKRNACQINNGGCEYMCLPDGDRDRICKCPPGVRC